MESIYNKLFIKNKCKKLLCIETKKFNTRKYIPKIIRNSILKNLLDNKKVVIFTDSILHRKILDIYINKKNTFLTRCFENKNLNIEYYDVVDFTVNPIQFLHMLNMIAKTKEELCVIWDFKSISKRFSKLSEIKKCIEDIFSYSNKNVCNIIYIYNIVYNFKDIRKFLNNFDDVVIEYMKSQILCSCNDNIDSTVTLLKYGEELSCRDNAIFSFNNMFDKIPKGIKMDKFTCFIVNELVNICDVDFCIIHTLNDNGNDIFKLDNFTGIINEYKIYLTESIERTDFKDYLLMNNDSCIDKSLKGCLEKIGVQSCAAIHVKYFDTIDGIIYVGRYHNYISEFDFRYIKDICKASFCIIQYKYMNFNLKSRLMENERLKLMGEIGLGVAHDINNILTPIIGCTQLLKDKIDDKNLLKQLKIIEICAYDGMNITNKVKKIAKQYNKSKSEIFSIDDLILDAVELTKSKWLMESAANGIKIVVVTKLNSKAKIKGNATEIREVFINIIRNCVDAMPYGGTINIISKCIKEKVRLYVKDDGIGMSKSEMEKIFEPFFTTKGNKGSGLGLSVSNDIIKEHNGMIRVFSKKNIGTMFEIELPISKEVIKHDDNLYDKRISFNGNILIIDDRQEIRNVISNMLKSMISDCKVKNCGCENIEQEIARRRYDVVICDFSMPSINGLQVANMVKKMYDDSYFCLMTGWVGEFSKEKLNKVDFILNKPINKSDIVKLFMDYKEFR
ncbi:hybrid sensor histidine kinase/response regulator [Clostridium fermenticellae]|nr:hybrid sensor histidine kinase/response regulator [Clostridium fermenticellae]